MWHPIRIATRSFGARQHAVQQQLALGGYFTLKHEQFKVKHAVDKMSLGALHRHSGICSHQILVDDQRPSCRLLLWAPLA